MKRSITRQLAAAFSSLVLIASVEGLAQQTSIINQCGAPLPDSAYLEQLRRELGGEHSCLVSYKVLQDSVEGFVVQKISHLVLYYLHYEMRCRARECLDSCTKEVFKRLLNEETFPSTLNPSSPPMSDKRLIFTACTEFETLDTVDLIDRLIDEKCQIGYGTIVKPLQWRWIVREAMRRRYIFKESRDIPARLYGVGTP